MGVNYKMGMLMNSKETLQSIVKSPLADTDPMHIYQLALEMLHACFLGWNNIVNILC